MDEPEGTQIPTTDLLAELHRLEADLGRVPTMRDMDFHGAYAAKTYQYRFGYWLTALEEAGLCVDCQA